LSNGRLGNSSGGGADAHSRKELTTFHFESLPQVDLLFAPPCHPAVLQRKDGVLR
jgi:hypothetical protein